MSVMSIFKTYSEADKVALKELQAHMAKQLGVEVKLADAIAAVTPGVETPEYLRGC